MIWLGLHAISGAICIPDGGGGGAEECRYSWRTDNRASVTLAAAIELHAAKFLSA